MDKRIDEQDIIKNLFLPKIALIKKVIGITPTQLQV